MSVDDDRPTATPPAQAFRLKPTAALWTFVGGALLCVLSVGFAGRFPIWLGAIVFGAGLAGLAMAWVKLRYRLHLGPEGIRVPRRPPLPWSTIRKTTVHEVGGIGGLEIESVGPDGNVQRIFVPRNLERRAEAMELLLQLAERHDAPWCLDESYADLRAKTGA